MKRWIKVEARTAEPPADWSAFADAFTRAGCDASLEGGDGTSIMGYLEAVPTADETADRLSAELRRLGAHEVHREEIPDQDWYEFWKVHFKPHRVGRRFVIVPSWESFAPGDEDIVLHLDPGQAFGTGEHPTTRLCLRLMESVPLSECDVLDLGCGSGILAIAAAKCGARAVTATDIEPAAVEIARQNAAKNDVTIELAAANGFGEWAEGRTWDVILSNIISATLIRLASDVAAVLRPEGRWIVSGVLKQNFEDVRRAAESVGLAPIAVFDEDDWIGAHFQKGSAP